MNNALIGCEARLEVEENHFKLHQNAWTPSHGKLEE
jgi:hypothetical protein